MIAFLYRWRIKSGREDQFIESWAAVTRYHREHSGSLGSRLHRGSDGIYYGYALWPSAETREIAFKKSVALSAYSLMREAIAESFPEVELKILKDLIIEENA